MGIKPHEEILARSLVKGYSRILDFSLTAEHFATDTLGMFPYARIDMKKYTPDRAALACIYHANLLQEQKVEMSRFFELHPNLDCPVEELFFEVEAIINLAEGTKTLFVTEDYKQF